MKTWDRAWATPGVDKGLVHHNGGERVRRGIVGLILDYLFCRIKKCT